MRFLIPIFILSTISGQADEPAFSIEVRPRITDKNRIYVVVQIENHTGRRITHLEGFVSEMDPYGKRISQRRLNMIRRMDPILEPKYSLSQGLHIPNSGKQDRTFVFEIAKLKFFGDYRVYTYHPAAGFIRID